MFVCLCIDVYSFCAYMTTRFVLYVHIICLFPFPNYVFLFNHLLKTPADHGKYSKLCFFTEHDMI